MRAARVFIDIDDVCNTLTPFLLNALGCPIGPTDYDSYPREHGYDIVGAANALLGEDRYTKSSFWDSVTRSMWADAPESPFFRQLLSKCEKSVGRENVFIATSPTKCPECLAGKLEWILEHFPAWMHRQYFITPRKHLLASWDSILIDDNADNIARFEERGGIGILIPRPWNNG